MTKRRQLNLTVYVEYDHNYEVAKDLLRNAAYLLVAGSDIFYGYEITSDGVEESNDRSGA